MIPKSNSKRKLSQCNQTPTGQATESTDPANTQLNQEKPASKRPRQRKNTVVLANSVGSSESAAEPSSQLHSSSQSSSVTEASIDAFNSSVCNPKQEASVQQNPQSVQDSQQQQQMEQLGNYLNDQALIQTLVNTENALIDQKADGQSNQVTSGHHHFESYESLRIDFIDENYTNFNQIEYEQSTVNNQQANDTNQQQLADGIETAGLLNGADFCLDSFDPNGFFNLNMNDLNYTNLYQNAW